MHAQTPLAPEATDATFPSAQTDFSFAIHLMQYLVMPAFVLDPQGRVLIWNNACERLTGLRAVEVFGTKEHWRAFYTTQRPCLADCIVENRHADLAALYTRFESSGDLQQGLHAENWCDMPLQQQPMYLAIDAGPIYDENGTLVAVIETLRDMTPVKVAQDALEEMAVHDGLTGIFNRRGFDDKLRQEWRRAERSHETLALLLIDVDFFKRYNDHYGHPSGDQCLRSIANVLREVALRPADMAARYGGEEFAVILPSIDLQGALTVAERIRAGIERLQIAHQGNEAAGVVTVSIGLVAAMPSRDLTLDEWVHVADTALYQAKRSGRNQVCAQAVTPPQAVVDGHAQSAQVPGAS